MKIQRQAESFSWRYADLVTPGVADSSVSAPEPQQAPAMSQQASPPPPTLTSIPREQFDSVLKGKGVNYEQHLNNLESHYNAATEDQKKRGRVWYRAGGDILGDIANKTGITKNRAIAMAAALSARTDWNNNLHFAAHMANHYRPGENEDDWKRANVHPTAMAKYMEDKHGIVPAPREAKIDRKTGLPTDEGDPDPSVFSHKELQTLRDQGYMPRTKADWNQLAEAHGGNHDQWVGSKDKGRWANGPLRGFEGLSDPQQRAEWLANAQMKSRGGNDPKKGQSPYEDAVDAHIRSVKETTSDVGYRPGNMYTGAGVPTLGGNIEKAKMLRQVPEEDFDTHLSGPKYKAFFSNLGNALRFRKANSPEDQGYYDHEGQHWSQHDPEYLRSTIDTQHMRAASTPHGGMDAAPGYKDSSDITPEQYEVYQQGLADLTHRINSRLPADRHLMPHQLQAIIWGKFKDDINAHEKIKNGAGQTYWSPSMHDVTPFADRYSRRLLAAGEHIDPALLDDPHSDPYQTDSDNWWNTCLDSWISRHEHELGPQYRHAASEWSYDLRTSTWRKRTASGPVMDADWKHRLMQEINKDPKNKGFTVREQPGDAPTSGQMVSLPRAEKHEESHLRTDQVSGDNQADYMKRKQPKIQSQPDLYGGGWDSEGQWYNDVSKHYQDPWQAASDAAHGQQDGIYDIDRGRPYNTDEYMGMQFPDPSSPGHHFGGSHG